ncbi:MAG TPA: sigma-70 family RNA polymerase sigma factor [Gaiellaceae bacterium]|nr:sigma-70 family RNA polymerase sigma factor [Gaiellaceae bacterium]
MSAVLHLERGADFDRLYRRHAPSVYRYAFAVLGRHADAEDVTQQTFLRAYRSVARGTKPRKAENWLLTIAHNEVRRHFRSIQGKPVEVELDDERIAHDASESSDPSLGDLLRALQQLSPTHRSALVMREFEGRSYAEIAELMGMTQSALEATIFRARRALAEQLEGELTCTEAEDALLRRLDGRLPRRVARRLKAHLRECATCVRHADVQKRQRAALRGLSALPIPASLFLFRPEHAAAAGLGATAAGSTALGGTATGVAGAGATGIGTGLAAKAAAVGAAAAVAGGVGVGVTTVEPKTMKTIEPKPTQRAVDSDAPQRNRVASLAVPIARVDQRAPARPRTARSAPGGHGEKRQPTTRPARVAQSALITHAMPEPAKAKEPKAEGWAPAGRTSAKSAKHATPLGQAAGGGQNRAAAKAAAKIRTALQGRTKPADARGTGPEAERPDRGPSPEILQAPGPAPARPLGDGPKK